MKTLISGYLERISSKIFDDYHVEITKLIGKERGVYALYKKDKLYYVGLATNLRTRVKQHLKDRHKQKWDTFSLFLIHNAQHLKELESLLIRIAEPKGNVMKGRFSKSKNLLTQLRKSMKERSKLQIESILTPRVSRKKKRKSNVGGKRTAPSVKGLLPVGTQIKVTYKKQEYRASVNAEGQIELDGKLYNSPSSAGSAVTGRANDGWLFWKYQNAQGQWVKLDELRRPNFLRKVLD